MKIWKYQLEPFEVVKYQLAPQAEPISVLVQGNDIILYVRDPDEFPTTRERYFGCFPTGDSDEFPGLRDRRPCGKLLGTVTIAGFVFHIYEVRPL